MQNRQQLNGASWRSVRIKLLLLTGWKRLKHITAHMHTQINGCLLVLSCSRKASASSILRESKKQTLCDSPCFLLRARWVFMGVWWHFLYLCLWDLSAPPLPPRLSAHSLSKPTVCWTSPKINVPNRLVKHCSFMCVEPLQIIWRPLLKTFSRPETQKQRTYKQCLSGLVEAVIISMRI